MHHVALVGYGTSLVPRVPFVLGSTPNDLDDVVVVHHGPHGARKARIVPGPDGCRLQLGPGTASLDEVLEALQEVDSTAGWRLELDGLSLPRPRDVTVWSVPPDTRWAAELTLPGGTRDEMAYLLGPFAPSDPPRLESLVAEGMALVAADRVAGPRGPIRTIELAYTVNEVAFRQWRALTPLPGGAHALVTAQSAVVRRERMRELVGRLAASF